MATYLFSVPILAGKTETWKNYIKELNGSRHEEYKKSRQRVGLRTEQVFLQQTPNGDSCVVRFESDNPQRVFENFAKSQEPFDKWFRDKILVECHGIDFSNPMQLNKQFLDLQEIPTRQYAEAKKS